MSTIQERFGFNLGYMASIEYRALKLFDLHGQLDNQRSALTQLEKDTPKEYTVKENGSIYQVIRPDEDLSDFYQELYSVPPEEQKAKLEQLRSVYPFISSHHLLNEDIRKVIKRINGYYKDLKGRLESFKNFYQKHRSEITPHQKDIVKKLYKVINTTFHKIRKDQKSIY